MMPSKPKRIGFPPTHDAQALLEGVAFIENTSVLCLIDELNDLHSTTYRLSDYLRGRQLPPALKSALRLRFQEDLQEQAEIREILKEKTGKIPVYASMIFGAFVLAMLL